MIVPSIDIQDGSTVQLIGGREKALDAGDPRTVAASFAPAGTVAVIDLDAAARGAGLFCKPEVALFCLAILIFFDIKAPRVISVSESPKCINTPPHTWVPFKGLTLQQYRVAARILPESRRGRSRLQARERRGTRCRDMRLVRLFSPLLKPRIVVR